MAEPAYIFGRVESPGGIQPPPTRLPFVQGIIPLLLALVGGYQLLGLRTTTLEPVSLQGALLVGTLVCGVWGAVRMRRSLRLRAFAKAHRAEPWLWDHPWTQETVAPQLATGPLPAPASPPRGPRHRGAARRLRAPRPRGPGPGHAPEAAARRWIHAARADDLGALRDLALPAAGLLSPLEGTPRLRTLSPTRAPPPGDSWARRSPGSSRFGASPSRRRPWT